MAALSKESIAMNGTGTDAYLENMIDGYSTYEVSGREYLTREINTESIVAVDGELVKDTRYPARTLEVKWNLTGTNETDLWDKLNHLNSLLDSGESDWIIADEPDKYWTGIPKMDSGIERRGNFAKGTFKIYCTFPFKRSVQVYTKSTANGDATISGNTATFSIPYNGTYPARPVLTAEFNGSIDSSGEESDAGDCGFVAFMDDEENIIQLGNPDAIETDAVKGDKLVNKCFNNITGWSSNGTHCFHPAKRTCDGSVSCSTITDTYWGKGKGQTLTFAKPTYGSSSATNWHGPMFYKKLSEASGQNFTLSLVHRFCVNKANQLGIFECSCFNSSSGKLVAGFSIWKTGTGTKGKIVYVVNDTIVKKESVDLGYYNENFGYCKKTKIMSTQYYNVAKKKWQNKKIKTKKTRKVSDGYKYTQSSINSFIKKKGSRVAFTVGNLSKVGFTDADIETTQIDLVTLNFFKYGNDNTKYPPVHTNAVRRCKVENQAALDFDELANVFTSGDIIEADCNDASVYLRNSETEEGADAPEYGALGNDWEKLMLEKGSNTIVATWSEWVENNPEISISYNEVYI